METLNVVVGARQAKEIKQEAKPVAVKAEAVSTVPGKSVSRSDRSSVSGKSKLKLETTASGKKSLH